MPQIYEIPLTLAGRVHVSRVGTAELAPSATVTVTVTKSDGTTVSKSATVGFYERDAEVGDYVYADGSYSAELDVTRAPIGICFYTNPENRKERLCFALDTIPLYSWGLRNDAPTKGISLISRPAYNVYDVPWVKNYLTSGLGSDNKITAELFRNESTSGDADGFKLFLESESLCEIGFVTLDTALAGFNSGTRMPWGLVNTLKIIEHRNIILTDPAINITIPQSYMDLINAMDSFAAENSDVIFKSYFFPASSLCNMWEPSVPVGVFLSEKFKAGNWFLPSVGELARIFWHYQQGAFNDAIDEGLLKSLIYATETYYHTSTEREQHQDWHGGIVNGIYRIGISYNGSKWSAHRSIPVTSF